MHRRRAGQFVDRHSSAVVDQHRRNAGHHIVRVASLRWSRSVHGADQFIDLRGWRERRSDGIGGWRW